jgi:hypothetical protein
LHSYFAIVLDEGISEAKHMEFIGDEKMKQANQQYSR